MIEKVQFQYSKDITVINQEQFDAHIRLYEGYVSKINEIDNILIGNAERGQANTTFSYYRECKRGETFSLNAVILHELYFENIGGKINNPDQAARNQLELEFGNLKNWQDDFIATAKASRGWAVLSYDQRSYRMRNISMDAHDLEIT
jgi:Fe-Mn family superoxide dismutase